MSQQSIILIGGPTASGKSALAMRLARERNGCIINADAMQIYAGLPILTAQPESKDFAQIPHLLYGVADAAEASSAGKWLAQACDAIDEARSGGRMPILVGGTGLYFEALTGGLADIPLIPDEARAKALKFYAEEGEEKFRAVLAKLDPESAARIARNDGQRLVRAYEVAAYTGKTLGEWQKEIRGLKNNFIAEYHLLMPKREDLYAACDKRFLGMIERGAVEEMKKFLERNLSPALPAMKILGVREIASYLRGEINLDEAISKAQQMTRNYAKRQMTWFRNKWKKFVPYG
jgi:tRNA dimethylallyltransferase